MDTQIVIIVSLSVGAIAGWHVHKLYIRRLYKIIHQLRKTVKGQ